eukprot:6018542-Prymnesium_polylepis.1
MRSCANQAIEGREQLAIGSRAIKRLRSEAINGLVRQSMTRRRTGHVTAELLPPPESLDVAFLITARARLLEVGERAKG